MCARVSMYICINVSLCVCMCVCGFMCVSVYTFMCVYVHICVCMLQCVSSSKRTIINILLKVIVIKWNLTFIFQYHIHEYSSKSVFYASGEYGLINKLKRQSTLSAKEDSEILVLSKGKYLEMLEKDPLLALLLSRICMVRKVQVFFFTFCMFLLLFIIILFIVQYLLCFSLILVIVILLLLIFFLLSLLFSFLNYLRLQLRSIQFCLTRTMLTLLAHIELYYIISYNRLI